MKLLLTTILVLAVLCSCRSQQDEIDNTQPMYGEVEKTREQKEIDQEFIENSLKQFGTIDSSVAVQIDHAWRFYYNNDLKTAMKRFNQAWLLNPEYPNSYFGFASLLESQGNLADAKRYYNIGIENDKCSVRTEICYQRTADCKEQLSDTEGTINAYSELTKSDPKNSFAFKKIGYFQMQSGQSKEEAKEAYKNAIEIDTEDAMTYNNRAYLNQTLKNCDEAINAYSRAIELNPEYISALVNRGVAEMEISQFEKAKSDFEKCVILDPNAGELRGFLVLAELELNENANACNNLQLAVNIGDKVATELMEKNCKN